MIVYTTTLKLDGRNTYHNDRDCPHLSDAGPLHAVDVEDVEETHRECERCRYAWVPTLD